MGLYALFQRFFKTKKRNIVETKRKKTGVFDSRPPPLCPPPFLVLYKSLGSEAESLNSQYVSEHSSIQTDIDDRSLIFFEPSVTSDASTHSIHNLFKHQRNYERHHLALIRERNALANSKTPIPSLLQSSNSKNGQATTLINRHHPWSTQQVADLSVDTQDAVLQVPSPVEGSPMCDFPSPHALWNNMTNKTATPTNTNHLSQFQTKPKYKFLQPSLPKSPDENSSIFSNGGASGSPGSPIPLTRHTAFGRHPLTPPCSPPIESPGSKSPALHDRKQLFWL